MIFLQVKLIGGHTENITKVPASIFILINFTHQTFQSTNLPAFFKAFTLQKIPPKQMGMHLGKGGSS